MITREILMFVLHTISIMGLLFIIDYKRPYENKTLNWSLKEKLVAFVIFLILMTILKIN